MAVKASFIVAKEIAHASKSFSEEAILKQCMLTVCDQVYPNQIQTFQNVNLSRNTIVEKLTELTQNTAGQRGVAT